MRLTTFDGVFILGLLLVLTGFALAEEEPSFVEVLSTGSNSANRIHVTNVALKRLIVFVTICLRLTCQMSDTVESRK